MKPLLLSITSTFSSWDAVGKKPLGNMSHCKGQWVEMEGQCPTKAEGGGLAWAVRGSHHTKTHMRPHRMLAEQHLTPLAVLSRVLPISHLSSTQGKLRWGPGVEGSPLSFFLGAGEATWFFVRFSGGAAPAQHPGQRHTPPVGLAVGCPQWLML